MNGADSVTLHAGGAVQSARFLGAGAAGGYPPFVGAYEVQTEGAEPRQVHVALGVDLLWSADATLDADAAAERIMRTVGLLCVEAHLDGRLAADA